MVRVRARLPVGRVVLVLTAIAVVLAALDSAARLGADSFAREVVGVLAVLLGLLALAWRCSPRTVRRIDIQPRDWSDIGGAYEYLIKPRLAGGRRRVTVMMPLPGGGAKEVVADVMHEATGEIVVRAGSPERVQVYVD